MSDPHQHSQRRRIWDRALNAAALKDYQDALANRVAQLVAGLEQRVQDGPLDLSQWISMFSYAPFDYNILLHALIKGDAQV